MPTRPPKAPCPAADGRERPARHRRHDPTREGKNRRGELTVPNRPPEPGPQPALPGSQGSIRKESGPHTAWRRRSAAATRRPPCLRQWAPRVVVRPRPQGGEEPSTGDGQVRQQGQRKRRFVLPTGPDRGDAGMRAHAVEPTRRGYDPSPCNRTPTPGPAQRPLSDTESRRTPATAKDHASGGGAPAPGAGGNAVGCGSAGGCEGLPSRPPSTQAEPSRHGPRCPGRSYSGALHLDTGARARSTYVWVDGGRDGSRVGSWAGKTARVPGRLWAVRGGSTATNGDNQ